MKNHKVPDFTQFNFNLPEELLPYLAWASPEYEQTWGDTKTAEVEVLAPVHILQRYPSYSYFKVVEDLVMLDNQIYGLAIYSCTYEVKND